MASNYLLDVLSEFDINYKYFQITVKNQLNRNYGHFYWLLCSMFLICLSIQTIDFLLIPNEDIESLKKFGSLSVYCGGKEIKLILDLNTLTYYAFILIVLFNYFFDKMQWLLKMSSIYEEIRTKHFDTILMNYAKSLSFYSKMVYIVSVIVCDLMIIALIIVNRDQLIDNPIGLAIVSLTMLLGAKIGYTLIIRQFVIIIFFCRMHCFLFKSCNKYFTQLSKSLHKNNLKTCLSLHYKLCESVEELQTFLRPMFVWITSLWCPIFCYIIYYTINNKRAGYNTIIILADIIIFIFFLLIFCLLSMIAMIDVEAKKGIHSVYWCGLKIKQASYPVKFR